MVILFATPYFSRKGQELQGGGFEVYLSRVSSALRELGHTPIIISFGEDNIHEVENGIEVIFVRRPQACLKVGSLGMKLLYERILQSFVLNKEIAKLVKQRHIDVIQFPSLSALALCYFGHTPAVMRMSSYSKIYNMGEDFNKKKIDIWGLCERLASYRCNAVFAPSNVIAAIFSHDIRRKVSVIESPFLNDLTSYDECIYSDKLRDKKYFLFFGRLVADKGILIIAKCLRRFLREYPEYYFVCCGDDCEINGEKAVDILKNAAGPYQEHFLHLPSLPHKMLYPVIKHADFVVCPSLIENLSNSCIEAMYFERIVIGTDGASYEQLISDGKSGLLCIPGDAQSLFAKMRQAAQMCTEQKLMMGKNAGKRIDRLKPELVVKRLLRYYKYIVDTVGK